MIVAPGAEYLIPVAKAMIRARGNPIPGASWINQTLVDGRTIRYGRVGGHDFIQITGEADFEVVCKYPEGATINDPVNAARLDLVDRFGLGGDVPSLASRADQTLIAAFAHLADNAGRGPKAIGIYMALGCGQVVNLFYAERKTAQGEQPFGYLQVFKVIVVNNLVAVMNQERVTLEDTHENNPGPPCSYGNPSNSSSIAHQEGTVSADVVLRIDPVAGEVAETQSLQGTWSYDSQTLSSRFDDPDEGICGGESSDLTTVYDNEFHVFGHLVVGGKIALIRITTVSNSFNHSWASTQGPSGLDHRETSTITAFALREQGGEVELATITLPKCYFSPAPLDVYAEPLSDTLIRVRSTDQGFLYLVSVNATECLFIEASGETQLYELLKTQHGDRINRPDGETIVFNPGIGELSANLAGVEEASGDWIVRSRIDNPEMNPDPFLTYYRATMPGVVPTYFFKSGDPGWTSFLDTKKGMVDGGKQRFALGNTGAAVALKYPYVVMQHAMIGCYASWQARYVSLYQAPKSQLGRDFYPGRLFFATDPNGRLLIVRRIVKPGPAVPGPDPPDP